jgi:hypothetical protein
MAIDFKTDIDGTAFNGITGLASTVSPVNGTAAVGTSTAVARQDHVHGTDTSRAPTVSPTFTGTVVLPSGQALIAPETVEGYAVFTGLPSQWNKTCSTASSWQTGVITSTAVAGTLATVGLEQTLSGTGATLTSLQVQLHLELQQ